MEPENAPHRADGEAGATLAAAGFLDLSTRQELVDAGLAILDQDAPLRLDLSAVEFMDSTGIGALIELARASERLGRPFQVVAASAQVRRVLEVTGLSGAWLVDP